MPSPWATVEPQDKLWFEQSNYVATHIAAMCYGLQVSIFFITCYRILGWRVPLRRRIFWLSFLFLLTITATVSIACSIQFNQDAWINERNYPGGPYQFLMQQQSRPILTLGNVASVMSSFLADGILLYRVMVLWNYIWYIIIPSTLFYIACIILSILIVIQIADPTFAKLPPLSFGVWLSLMIINIVLSSMIVIRILAMRRLIKSGLGSNHAKPYAELASIVVEAALPFAILSIVLLVLFGGNNIAQNLFVPLLVQIECLAPELIILRVIIRRGSEDDQGSLTPISDIQFAPGSAPLVSARSTLANSADNEEQGEKADGASGTNSFSNDLHENTSSEIITNPVHG